eukprot:4842752-Amphidinium_carterae.1
MNKYLGNRFLQVTLKTKGHTYDEAKDKHVYNWLQEAATMPLFEEHVAQNALKRARESQS